MAHQVISVADKPTLDATKALTQVIDSKCDQILGAGGGQALDKVSVYVLDFVNDEIYVMYGGVDAEKRIAST